MICARQSKQVLAHVAGSLVKTVSGDESFVLVVLGAVQVPGGYGNQSGGCDAAVAVAGGLPVVCSHPA